jgi:anti-sigma28 factor (negative regulator of flagellin synthesis)
MSKIRAKSSGKNQSNRGKSRSKKLQSIMKKVQSGRYHVSGEALAKAIIEFSSG